MARNLLSSATISAWAASHKQHSSLLPRREVLRGKALKLWNALTASRKSDFGLEDVDVADLGYALREIVLEDTAASAEATALAFDFLTAVDWPPNELSEKPDILADIAYMASVRYRRQHDYPAMRQWEERCTALLRESEPAATFLVNRETNNGSRADKQFLLRPAVLLAVCRHVEKIRNYRPPEASAQALSAFEASEGASIPWEELCYLRADLSLSAAVARCHAGDFESFEQLRVVARSLFSQSSFAPALLVAVATSELVSKYARLRWQDVLDGVPAVLAKAKAFGMSWQVVSLRVLQASALKDCGRFEEAFEQYRSIDEEKLTADPLMLAVILCGLAEVQHALGDDLAASNTCHRASLLAGECNVPIGWGFLHGLIGQLLRETGQSIEALKAFDRAIEDYSSGGLASQQALVMIMSAELLLGIGRHREGVARLLAALAILRKTKVDGQIAVAVELLRAAMRSGLAPSALAISELRTILSRHDRPT